MLVGSVARLSHSLLQPQHQEEKRKEGEKKGWCIFTPLICC
jgi:hypothetical protein